MSAKLYVCLYLTESGSLTAAKLYVCLYLTESGSLSAARLSVFLYLTESGSLHGSKDISMPVFDREWELKRQQSYMYTCIRQRVGV